MCEVLSDFMILGKFSFPFVIDVSVSMNGMLAGLEKVYSDWVTGVLVYNTSLASLSWEGPITTK